MDDLISRDALKDALAKHLPFAVVTLDDLAFASGLDAAYVAVKNAPTIDPVRHGRWIRIVEGDEEYWKCSDCKQEQWLGYGGSDSYNYCPNCGAKMDAEDGAVHD